MTKEPTPATPLRKFDETFEPYEGTRPIPLPIYWIAIALAIWGGVTLFESSDAITLGQKERIAQVTQVPSGAVVDGAAMFLSRCATCHQPNGSGVVGAIPPLAGSPFLAADASVVIQILLHGIDGPIRVSDAVYDGHMPNFASVLSDDEIAKIATYVRTSWGGDSTVVQSHAVTGQRGRFPGRPTWRGGEDIAAVLAPSLAPQPAFITQPTIPDDPVADQLINKGRTGTWGCASCHGLRGQGSGTVPRLAGLQADYIRKQLNDYVAGRRSDDSMKIVAQSLTTDEMTMLGLYYAGLNAPSTARPLLGGDVKRGQRLALEGDWSRTVPACFSCHGASGFGVAPIVPALAAQHPAYTATQLAKWVGGNRTNSDLDLMNHVSKGLSDADRRAVADYFATLPPTPVRMLGSKER